MDGGIDLVYLHASAGSCKKDFRRTSGMSDGECQWEATIVETFDTAIYFLVSAPTMRIPMNVSIRSMPIWPSGRHPAVKLHNRDVPKPPFAQ
jgi:hypothetical protein